MVSVATATIAELLLPIATIAGAIITGCVDVCLEKKKRFWGEAGTGYLPNRSNELKVWRRWSGFLLSDCCGWVVVLGSACVEICWGWDHWETSQVCRQLGQEFDSQGAP